ncbi:MAG: penicillin acylase family protein [Streptosporangiaceae bacterium]
MVQPRAFRPAGRPEWPRRIRRGAGVAVAACVSAALLALLAAGYGTVPPLGPALDPWHGAWTSAAGGTLPGSQTLTVAGLAHPARVTFTREGLASITAASTDDAALALGYLHAEFRLGEMDLERRLAEGRLAQLAGPAAVASDKFELRLGLLRTARREWADTPRSSPAAQALLGYARGVNDYLARARASGQWSALFSMTGVYPSDWTPVDSLAVQGDLTQELDFTTMPLDYALLDRSLGIWRTMAWFPVRPANQQNPYDPGPYRNRGIAPLVTSGAVVTSAGTAGRGPEARTAAERVPAVRVPAVRVPAVRGLAVRRRAAGSRSGPAAAAWPRPGRVSRSVARAAADLLAQVRALPPGQLHSYPDSNAWAANGPRVAGGRALLAGDPHLPQTLPSVWYQVAMSAPGLAVTGVSVPGLPAVLIGHNQHIAWSLTDTQNQSTLFYTERTSPRRPGQYFWRGRWRAMGEYRYSIPVRGAATERLTVRTTVHGPIMTQAGQTEAVDWMGNVPSPDVAVLLAINTASSFAQFRAALASWRAPTQNFVYADDRGNIGAISAGYCPLVRHGQPWLPLSGTGADDVAGVIPYTAIPQVYDPPGHVVATANQRPVSGSYPYFIGTTANDFDPGYRASEEYAYLTAHSGMRPASFAALQTSLTDRLAVRIVPRLLAALRQPPLAGQQRQAVQLMAGWNESMTAGSAAASLWWTFWGDYLSAVFRPWWSARHVPVGTDRHGLSVSADQASLDQVLEAWTLHDQRNPAFTPPGGPARDAAAAMRAAFAAAVGHLHARLGGSPGSWAWGRLHSRQFPALTQAAALGYGPRPAGGDPFTVDAADGGLIARQGPSWRMIAGWSAPGVPVAEGIYPGGQSENPASPWYENLISDWWNGRYLPVPPAGRTSGPIRWELRP